MTAELILAAMKTAFFKISQAFLDHGWNINTSTIHFMPLALACALSSMGLMELANFVHFQQGVPGPWVPTLMIHVAKAAPLYIG